MAMNGHGQQVDRRGFLKAAVATAVAATATGGGAALLLNKAQSATTVLPTPIPEPPAIQAAQTVLTAHNDAAELLARLTAAQADNMRLQAALDATQRQLESLQTANADSSVASESLSLELASTTEQLGILSGLVALYEQLDGVDVAGTLGEGLTAVSQTLTDLMDNTPTLRDSIAAGQQALDELDAHIPTIEEGRIWLDTQLGQVQSFYDSVGTLLESAVDTIGPFLEMLNQWFADVRKWLPFGIGERAAEIMQALTLLIGETPTTVAGVRERVAQPLDVWVGAPNEEAPLRQKIVKPMRERVLTQAGETIARAEQVQTAYQGQLAEPVQTAVSSQQIIREQITQYRERHQV